MDLENKTCKPCEKGTKPLSKSETSKLIKEIPGWEINDENTIISRDLKFKNFLRTMEFVNAVAFMTNQQGHHPDIKLGYNYSHIEYTTHAIDGLSENDFICAKKVNELFDQIR